ncbi:asparagine synthase (glutamine-hydrolyzing) [candidate division KSB1 bacterium]|nr:asparagine synthase (glutamine-hydrolyzing) [candidate division KSB1 bacterium]
MCGICGIVDPAGTIEHSELSAMAARMHYRGPDADGAWVSADRRFGLGHRRLSIIDLDPRSNQPFLSADGRLVISFNGEIYNYRELKRELEGRGHHFRTASDTEVILSGYREWGLDCLHRFRGMFAFGLFDLDRERLWLVRDRFGKKPLLYYRKADLLAFASDFRCFEESPRFDLQLDLTALYDCLTYNYIPAPKTAYQHVRKLEAGCWMLWERGEFTERRYWDITEFGTNDVPLAQTVQRVRELIDESTRLRMISDVPVGVLLSGGLDSSTVAYYAQQHSATPIKTFSIGFDVKAYDELRHATYMAEAIHAEHTTQVYDFEAARADLKETMHLYGEPHGDSSIFPTTAVSRIARQHVTVALAGDGGDEVFYGYRHFLAHARHAVQARLPLHEVGQRVWQSVVPMGAKGRNYGLRYFLEDLELHTVLLGGLTRADKLRLVADDLLDATKDYDDYWFFRKYWRAELPLATRLQYLDLKTYLVEGVLMKVDRASMSCSLETRTPLLNHPLVEEVFSWPERVRLDGDTLKYLFKKAMTGVLPELIIDKPKQGFSIPWRSWVRNIEELRMIRGRGLFFKKGLVLPPLYTALAIQDWLRIKTQGRFV